MFKKESKDKIIRDEAVRVLYPLIKEYSKWYDEHGIYLPPEYKNDPTAWTEALHKMEKSFRMLYENLNEEGELWSAENRWKEFGEKDAEAVKEIEKEIAKGLTLFGSQLVYMVDPKWTRLQDGVLLKDKENE
jgi:hypothetical protein